MVINIDDMDEFIVHDSESEEEPNSEISWECSTTTESTSSTDSSSPPMSDDLDIKENIHDFDEHMMENEPNPCTSSLQIKETYTLIDLDIESDHGKTR